ncbi:MAG: MlaD family protein [Solirubrobacterales bacterium]
MRRIGLTLALVVLGAATLAVGAGAEDSRKYQAELFNAFGIVKGSELRIAGVKAGTITDLDITPQKTALISFEVDPEFPELTSEASCSSEPQSLIAEYFLDCQPGSGDAPLEGPIPAARNQTTVQNDLVQNTLREPFKRRFQLILNEFGTALVANAENLNPAIRAGAPALRELSKVLKILGRQNTLIAQLNVDADQIFARLAERREDVVGFIDEAEDTARISAERRDDLARNFDLLDDFLFELKPVMIELANLARQQTPLLIDLKAAAPGLKKLGTNLPRFNNASRDSLRALGDASAFGHRAVVKAKEEIAQLNTTALKAQPAGDLIATFLESLDDPRRAVEEDCDARTDLRELPGEADRRVALLEQRIGGQLTGSQSACGAGGGTGNPGYTGLEGLLNYGYVQAASLNLFDRIGHGLSIQIVGEGTASEAGECGEYSAGGPVQGAAGDHGGWPKRTAVGAGNTQDIREAAHCVSVLGDYQPGITPGTIGPGGTTRLGSTTLPPYHPSVCSAPVASGSTNTGICDPDGAPRAGLQSQSTAPTVQEPVGGKQQPGGKPTDPIEDLTPKEIREILGLPPKAPLPPLPDLGNPLPTLPPAPGPSSSSGGGILDFLLAP